MKFLTCFFVFLSINFKFFAQEDSLKVNRILALCERIENDERFQNNPTSQSSNSTLPIGIMQQVGNTMYIICIDSARYTTDGAYFNVYMALDFPGADRKIAFEAKNIKFNPKGVIGGTGARLQLVTEQKVNLGPNMQLVFKNDGFNYIEWDCNGYSQAGLSVDVLFNPEKIIHATDSTKIVTANFRTEIRDLKDLLISIPTMDPFRVKGAGDFIFQLTNLAFDQSESRNPSNLALPSQTIQLYNGNVNLWNGFFAQNITITLPKKLSPKNANQNTTITANNLILDQSGVTGTFGATNILDLTAGSMNNWGFSISNISAQFTCNHLTGGSLAGTVQVPIMDNQGFVYQASIVENQQTKVLDYKFIIQPDSSISIPIPCLGSTVKIDSTTRFEVTSMNGKFYPKAILNGLWSTTGSKANITNIRFQNFTIISESPTITAGVFSLTSTDSSGKKLMRFPISLNQIGFGLHTDNTLKLMFGLSLNLGESPNNFSASTAFTVYTKDSTDSDGRKQIKYNRIGIDNIGFELNTTPFYLQGMVAVRDNDPTFGDLFYGQIAFRLKSVMENNITTAVGFGKMPNFRYWYVEAGLPTNIPLTPTVSISKIFGGVQNRIKSSESDAAILARVAGSGTVNISQPSQPLPFIPDSTQGVVFRVGAAFENNTKQDLLNGEAMFQVSFNPSGGFQNISLLGNAYMLVTRDKRLAANVKKVYGQLAMNYDNVNKIFDAQLNGGLIIPSFATGQVNVKIHIDQNDWYVWINRPTNRAYVSLVGLFTINAYFMVGTQIDPIPAPPNAVTQLLGQGSFANMNMSAISSGDGFASGAAFTSVIDESIPLLGNWHGFVYANCGAGFDVTMFRVNPNTHCSGSTDPVGINSWYCMGQVYGYINASLGVKRIVDNEVKENITLAGINTAFLLQGKLPKPTYVSGSLAVQFQFLTFNVGVTTNVSFGNDCTFVTN